MLIRFMKKLEQRRSIGPPIDEGWGGRFVTLQDPDKYRFFFVTWSEKGYRQLLHEPIADDME